MPTVGDIGDFADLTGCMPCPRCPTTPLLHISTVFIQTEEHCTQRALRKSSASYPVINIQRDHSHVIMRDPCRDLCDTVVPWFVPLDDAALLEPTTAKRRSTKSQPYNCRTNKETL
eukprot:scpid63277/ scgid24465/ 